MLINMKSMKVRACLMLALIVCSISCSSVHAGAVKSMVKLTIGVPCLIGAFFAANEFKSTWPEARLVYADELYKSSIHEDWKNRIAGWFRLKPQNIAGDAFASPIETFKRLMNATKTNGESVKEATQKNMVCAGTTLVCGIVGLVFTLSALKHL
ncbi:MAG: hypothetical protein UU47_C0014G0033 [candidate division TM6 bacterium GW2011_GWE2_41_16]|nr:MAG: hypothetical protein UU47_C0014G0033 [candidate division TM6 bacterium GW2011_GWE2_41_16]